MTFEVKEPVLVIGLGGAGIKLASEMREVLGADSLKISQDKRDVSEHNSIHISTKSIINPSVQLIRGCAMEQSEKIAKHVSTYETVIIMANLAGKSGAALAPVVSSICKEQNKNVLSFAIMPFKFEKDRIFQSGISLKRLRMNSDSTIIIDNDAILDSNPDLSAEKLQQLKFQLTHFQRHQQLSIVLEEPPLAILHLKAPQNIHYPPLLVFSLCVFWCGGVLSTHWRYGEI